MGGVIIHPGVTSALLSVSVDKETSWLLLGTNDGEITVKVAVYVGQGELSGVGIDKPLAFREVLRLRQKDNQLMIVGFAHTHLTGHVEPSVFDYRGDSKWVEGLPGREGVFGIVAGGGIGWFRLAAGNKWYRKIGV